jgi:hypothetical protein
MKSVKILEHGVSKKVIKNIFQKLLIHQDHLQVIVFIENMKNISKDNENIYHHLHEFMSIVSYIF